MNKAIEFIVPSNKKDCDYVGFDLESNSSRFVFPCKYIDSKNFTDDSICKSEAKRILTLIKTVQKEYLFGGSRNEAYQFYSMTWLVRDYVEKGYYTETEKIVKKSESGKINWKETIKKSGIYFNNGNIIYKNLYRNKNALDTGSLMMEIYKCCLAYSVERVGFLFGITDCARSIFKMSPQDTGFMCCFLKQELSDTYNSYKKILINHLLTVLTGLQGKSKSISLSMSDSEFEYVFEYLINDVFGTEDVRKYYNQSSYVIDGQDFSASKLRPDTVMANPKPDGEPDYFIIDAKYYNYGYTNNHRDLPQSSSITKQIGYNHYLEDKENGKKFYSVFLLPFSKSLDQNPIRYVGYAKNEKDTPKKFENKVAVCLVDLKSLVDTHFGIGIPKEDFKNNLIDVVEECFGSQA